MFLGNGWFFSNKFDDVSMNMFPFRFLGTGGENEFLFLNCAMCKDCHLLLCCWMPRIFLVPREIWKDNLCDTVALFGTPCPPKNLGVLNLSKKIKDIEKQDYSTTGISIPVENGLKLSKPLFACNGLKKKRVLFPLFMVSVQNKNHLCPFIAGNVCNRFLENRIQTSA